LLQAKLGSSVGVHRALESVLHPVHGHGEGDIVMPVTTVPTLHSVAEMQQHVGHKILLRFVLITLPPQQLRRTRQDEELSDLGALSSVQDEDGTHSGNMYHREAASLLPADIRQLLRDMHKLVQALREAQQQLHRATVDKVLHCMAHLSPCAVQFHRVTAEAALAAHRLRPADARGQSGATSRARKWQGGEHEAVHHYSSGIQLTSCARALDCSIAAADYVILFRF
jgi:hypothetical protein